MRMPSAISGRVTTAATGCPFAIGLPSVTMSGVDVVALVSPERLARASEARLHLVADEEAARRAHALDAPASQPGATVGMPSLESTESTISAAGAIPSLAERGERGVDAAEAVREVVAPAAFDARRYAAALGHRAHVRHGSVRLVRGRDLRDARVGCRDRRARCR